MRAGVSSFLELAWGSRQGLLLDVEGSSALDLSDSELFLDTLVTNLSIASPVLSSAYFFNHVTLIARPLDSEELIAGHAACSCLDY